ncbi:MAG: hypothetical protein H6R24_2729, partial [Proteobacteria bacterium]|nr:hypothetical protein [Pseudomonadota bacterium]
MIILLPTIPATRVQAAKQPWARPLEAVTTPLRAVIPVPGGLSIASMYPAIGPAPHRTGARRWNFGLKAIAWAPSRFPPTGTGARSPLPARHYPGLRPGQESGGPDQLRTRPARRGQGRAHRPGGRRGHRRAARRAFPAGGLADWQRHAIEHERQRGHRQPRERTRGPA